jgi:hypothetical protein
MMTWHILNYYNTRGVTVPTPPQVATLPRVPTPPRAATSTRMVTPLLSTRGTSSTIPEYVQTTVGQVGSSQPADARAMGSGSRSGRPFKAAFRRSEM